MTSGGAVQPRAVAQAQYGQGPGARYLKQCTILQQVALGVPSGRAEGAQGGVYLCRGAECGAHGPEPSWKLLLGLRQLPKGSRVPSSPRLRNAWLHKGRVY